MNKDWTGNTSLINGCNSRNIDSELNDYYATDPIAVKKLLEVETFNQYVWESACGEGHISKVLEEAGYNVVSTDLIDRGYGQGNKDFLKHKVAGKNRNSMDIITNPPYKYAREFVEHALEISMESVKIAMFLKLTFVSSKSRKELFEKFPPSTIYVFSKRVECGKNGEFKGKCGVDYAWFIWKKGYVGSTHVKWI